MAVFLLAIGGACCLGLGFVLQQHAAQRAPRADLLRWRLLLDLVRMPEWLVGIGAMVVGLVLSALALGLGEVSLVEPLLATNLVFAMALASVLTRQSLGRSGWGGVLLLGVGVTTFILAGDPRSGGSPAGALRHWLVFGVVAGLALLLVSLARRLPLFEEATLLAVAAGLLYGLQDALTRATASHVDSGGLVSALHHWEPYVVVGLGAFGLLLVQSAFEAAPLRMSLPALTAAQPLAGIVCAVGFLGDRLRVTPGALAWEAAGLAAMVAGVVIIGRHPAMPTGTAGTGATGGAGGGNGGGDEGGAGERNGDSGSHPVSG
ncbi:DMT family transporter [Kitasatospora nipponensis]|uniref:DMT family transporter n=1 Tax=Kitasatospora nipponensis TaxID=258049 RepID=A0ABP4H134_9ACTN